MQREVRARVLWRDPGWLVDAFRASPYEVVFVKARDTVEGKGCRRGCCFLFFFFFFMADCGNNFACCREEIKEKKFNLDIKNIICSS